MNPVRGSPSWQVAESQTEATLPCETVSSPHRGAGFPFVGAVALGTSKEEMITGFLAMMVSEAQQLGSKLGSVTVAHSRASVL